jgi:hypothetical protein
MRSLWSAHYPRCPWWTRWFTWHWWKAKIWEANHGRELPQPGPFGPSGGRYAIYEKFEGYHPLSERGGYVGRVDTRSTEQMFKDLEKLCPTLSKNDGNN